MKQSALLTVDVVKQAIKYLEPAFQELMRCNGRSVVYIVVLDPACPEFRVVWEGAIGEQDSTKWKSDYKNNAIRKAYITKRTGIPGHMVQRVMPQLFRPGEFKYYGSAVHNGIVVGASGLKECHDYLVSSTIAVACEALCMEAMEKVLAKESAFVGKDETAEMIL